MSGVPEIEPFGTRAEEDSGDEDVQNTGVEGDLLTDCDGVGVIPTTFHPIETPIECLAISDQTTIGFLQLGLHILEPVLDLCSTFVQLRPFDDTATADDLEKRRRRVSGFL